MPTSGSYTYSITATELMNAAAQDIGVLEAGDSLSADDQALMLQRLNFIVKQWSGNADMAPGLKVWTRQRITVFFVNGQIKFTISSTSSDKVGLNVVATTLTAAKSASAVSVTVTSTAGMAASDTIGFVTSAGSLGWTTISSVDSSTGLTLAANSVGAASNGAVVYAYTSAANRFEVLENAILRDNSTAGQPIDISLRVYTDLQEYEAIAQKYAPGDPTAVWVEQQRTSSVVYTNASSPNTYRTLELTVLYPQEDYTAITNDVAFPQVWYAALEWELALRCCPAFGRVWTPEMQANYANAVPIARQLNPANTSRYFEPGRDE